MTYEEAIEKLCVKTPMFQQVGSDAYKPGLVNTLHLDEYYGHPYRKFRSVHIAGTNGKGSTAHTLAAILQAAGYRTGLYTSPHLTDFSERIRVNGIPINSDFVVNFLEKDSAFHDSLQPSFFELTTQMAFCYFAWCGVDVAVIETGLGGRLDCTNIIYPDLTVITNVGFDHTQFLGDTLAEIAAEKAGIIKPGVTAVIGEDCAETRPVFEKRARECFSRTVFAQDNCKILSSSQTDDGKMIYETLDYPALVSELGGLCQQNNANTILYAVSELQRSGWQLPESAVRKGFAEVCEMTGLRGRWQTLRMNPRIICDTGHNSHGLKYVADQLERLAAKPGSGHLRIVFGMVSDKDVDKVLEIMPKNAEWYFTQASVKRAISAESLRKMAAGFGCTGRVFGSVAEAVRTAKSEAASDDIIYVGGSTFVVAELLSMPEFRE